MILCLHSPPSSWNCHKKKVNFFAKKKLTTKTLLWKYSIAFLSFVVQISYSYLSHNAEQVNSVSLNLLPFFILYYYKEYHLIIVFILLGVVFQSHLQKSSSAKIWPFYVLHLKNTKDNISLKFHWKQNFDITRCAKNRILKFPLACCLLYYMNWIIFLLGLYIYCWSR